jgi:VanZ family protein
VRYVLTITATVLVFVAVFWPSSGIPHANWPVDKPIHFTMFLGWTSAFCYEVTRKWYVAAGAGMCMALISELVQIPLEGRTFDTDDLIADGIGVVLAVAFAPFFTMLIKKILRRE